MQELDYTKLAALCLDELYRDGYDVAQEPMDPISEQRILALGKSSLTPAMSATVNDFTQESAFCLFLTKSGKDVACAGAKFASLGSEPVENYWQRIFTRQYPPKDDGPTVSFRSPEILQGVGGRLVYMGELYVSPDDRGHRKRLETFVRLLHCMCGLKWEYDWLYAFLRRRDAELGFGTRYGFTRQIPNPLIWRFEQGGRGEDEYLMMTAKGEHNHLVRAALSRYTLTGRE